MSLTTISIVIPVYNEEATLAEVVERVRAVDLGPIEREIILSDDGSSDATPAEIARLRGLYPELKTYTAPINLGKGAAVRVGMSLATGDVILIQDADLELDPDDIPAILAPFEDPTVQVVYGSRFLRGAAGVPRAGRWANRFLTLLTNLLFRGRLTDMETAYKAMRREALRGLRLRCVRFDIEPELTARLLQAGHRIIEVPITYRPRTVEQGKKMAWGDGLDAIYTLLRCRLVKR